MAGFAADGSHRRVGGGDDLATASGEVAAGLNADLELAVAAARRAGAVVMRHFGREMVVEMKAPGQPLTEADLAADALLKDMLLGERPGYGWLSEETADGPDRLARRRVWIVDPIDGTRSFIAGLPEFSISIGLAVDGAAAVGVVYNPARDELFHAIRGNGARVTAEGDDHPLRTVSSGHGAATGLPTMLASRSEIAAGEFDGLRDGWHLQPVGSTAYKLAMVAAGTGSAYVSRGPKSEWDVCAGVLLVREAGGRVTDMEGGDPAFNRRDPYVHGMLAAEPTLHESLLRRVAELPPTGRMTDRQRED
jgi:myo-inositol-1(or 4)-monophosphatase